MAGPPPVPLVHRHRVVAALGVGVTDQVAHRPVHTSPACRQCCVVVGERVAAGRAGTRRPVSPPWPRCRAQPATSDAVGALGREQRNVAGHHHHVEGAAEVDRGEILGAPRSSSGASARAVAIIDGSRSTPTTSTPLRASSLRHPTGPAPGIEDGGRLPAGRRNRPRRGRRPQRRPARRTAAGTARPSHVTVRSAAPWPAHVW